LTASAEAFAEESAPPPPPTGGGVARNTAIFSIATGISRVAGLVREIIAAGFFGTRGPASAYTIAFQIPNLISNLFANAALSAAFVPVFTELLQKGRRKEALRLASTLFWIMLIGLGALTAFFILGAGVIMPLFTGASFNHQLDELTVGLSQVLFPVILLLGLNGLLVGILQSYDHFTIPAISPAVWNLVIIVLLVLLKPHFHGGYEDGHELYALAIAVLIATLVQLTMAFGALGRIDFRLQFHIDWRDPRIAQVFMLMLPVTIGLGIVNLDQLINAAFGGLVDPGGPSAINYAFRVYMLPQGMFSVAVALTTGIAFGLWPALRLSRVQIGNMVKAGTRRVAGSVHGRRTHNALIAGQIGLTLLLLAAAGSAVEGFIRMLHAPLGYDPHNVMSVGIPVREGSYATWAARAAYFAQLRAKVAEAPGVSVLGPGQLELPPIRVVADGSEEDGRTVIDAEGGSLIEVLTSADAPRALALAFARLSGR